MLFGLRLPTSFSPEKDIPSLEGKVILVTGGSDGLGKQSVLELARHRPALIWIAVRNLDKAKAAVEEIKQDVPDASIKLLHLDLSSLDSVDKAARVFKEQADRLDVLLLNAGTMSFGEGVTADGYEVHFGVNHVGHALLTKLLLPVLLRTAESGADVRVVLLSSTAYLVAPYGGIKYNTVKGPAENLWMMQRYGQSKLAVKLFAWQLAKLYPQLTVASVSPGLVKTNIVEEDNAIPCILRPGKAFLRATMMSTVENGARNQLWASVSKDVQSGAYYEFVGVPTKLREGAQDMWAAELWRWTEKELERYNLH